LPSLPPASWTPDYFREVAAILNAAVADPPDLAGVGEVMRRHGLTPARCRLTLRL